jgi:hypothetical protein
MGEQQPHGARVQEAKNAELHKIDHSHTPPLRIAVWYAAGRSSALRRGSFGGD